MKKKEFLKHANLGDLISVSYYPDEKRSSAIFAYIEAISSDSVKAGYDSFGEVPSRKGFYPEEISFKSIVMYTIWNRENYPEEYTHYEDMTNRAKIRRDNLEFTGYN